MRHRAWSTDTRGAKRSSATGGDKERVRGYLKLHFCPQHAQQGNAGEHEGRRVVAEVRVQAKAVTGVECEE